MSQSMNGNNIVREILQISVKNSQLLRKIATDKPELNFLKKINFCKAQSKFSTIPYLSAVLQNLVSVRLASIEPFGIAVEWPKLREIKQC